MKISNLPNNIQKHNNHFAIELSDLYVSVGPKSPKAGPILPIADAEAPSAETKSRLKKVRTKDVKTNIKR